MAGIWISVPTPALRNLDLRAGAAHTQLGAAALDRLQGPEIPSFPVSADSDARRLPAPRHGGPSLTPSPARRPSQRPGPGSSVCAEHLRLCRSSRPLTHPSPSLCGGRSRRCHLSLHAGALPWLLQPAEGCSLSRWPGAGWGAVCQTSGSHAKCEKIQFQLAESAAWARASSWLQQD